MKIIVTAGGTGGHIYPALAIIEKIKTDGTNQYLYIGTEDRMESELIPKLGIPYESLKIHGLSRNIFRNFKNLADIYVSYKKCIRIIKEFKPDAIIAFGGYVTLPVVLAAKKMKVKIAIHEQNIIPGKTNKYLSKKSNIVFTSFLDTKKYFKNSRVICSGNPCAERALSISEKDKTELGFSREKKLILIVMGSMGSSAMNEKLLEFLKTYEEKDKEILFITGKSSYESVRSINLPKSTKVVSYIENLPGLMKSADLIISRAGASTISEILAVKLPSILIPSPYVANNHQYYNALEVKNKGLGFLLEESFFTVESLKETIKKVLDDKKNYIDLKNHLNELNKPNASTVIYEEIKKF